MILERWRGLGHRLMEWLVVVLCFVIFWPEAARGQDAKKKDEKARKRLAFPERQYQSHGMVSVRMEELVPGLNKEDEGWDKAFLREQEIVEAEGTLRGVVQRLNLVKRWEMEDEGKAVAHLKPRLRIEHMPKTALIRISVRSTDPVEAAELARAVMEVYADRRNGFERVQADEDLRALEQQLKDQEERVAELRKRHGKVLKALENDPEAGEKQDVIESLHDLNAAEDILLKMKTLFGKEKAKLRVPRRVVSIHEVPSVPTRPVR